MTKTNLLEKRKRAIEQRMNRLRSQETALNVQLRKKRTRRLIELGGFVSKAQLEDWNANTLLGALLFIKEQEANAIQLKEWSDKGGSTFAVEKSKSVSTERSGSSVVLKFNSKLSNCLEFHGFQCKS